MVSTFFNTILTPYATRPYIFLHIHFPTLPCPFCRASNVRRLLPSARWGGHALREAVHDALETVPHGTSQQAKRRCLRPPRCKCCTALNFNWLDSTISDMLRHVFYIHCHDGHIIFGIFTIPLLLYSWWSYWNMMFLLFLCEDDLPLLGRVRAVSTGTKRCCWRVEWVRHLIR